MFLMHVRTLMDKFNVLYYMLGNGKEHDIQASIWFSGMSNHTRAFDSTKEAFNNIEFKLKFE